MAASQQRKDNIYRRVDNYARHQRNSIEEVRYAQYAEQVKHSVRILKLPFHKINLFFKFHQNGHGLDAHNIDRKNNRKESIVYVLQYPGSPTKVIGNTLYAKLYLNDQIVQNYQVGPQTRFELYYD